MTTKHYITVGMSIAAILGVAAMVVMPKGLKAPKYVKKFAKVTTICGSILAGGVELYDEFKIKHE